MASISNIQHELNVKASGPATHITDGKVTYADTGDEHDLDDDAKRVACANTTNGLINEILVVLEANGLVATS